MNGTWRNGAKLKPQVHYALDGGETLAFGDVKVEFILTSSNGAVEGRGNPQMDPKYFSFKAFFYHFQGRNPNRRSSSFRKRPFRLLKKRVPPKNLTISCRSLRARLASAHRHLNVLKNLRSLNLPIQVSSPPLTCRRSLTPAPFWHPVNRCLFHREAKFWGRKLWIFSTWKRNLR